jgi:hypothetical protein
MICYLLKCHHILLAFVIENRHSAENGSYISRGHYFCSFLTTLSVQRLCSISDRAIAEYGTVDVISNISLEESRS